MRLLGKFSDEKEVYLFSGFLTKEGLKNRYETSFDETTKEKGFQLWIDEEDDFPIAAELLDQFRKNPQDPKFVTPEPVLTPPVSSIPVEPGKNQWKVPLKVIRRPPFHFFLTQSLLMLCIFLFMWNQQEERDLRKTYGEIASKIGMTSIEKVLFFDYPQAYEPVEDFIQNTPIQDKTSFDELSQQQQEFLIQAERGPFWHGLLARFAYPQKAGESPLGSGPLFEKIRQGEIWRLFTPCLLHQDLLHILFNMVWLWVLGKQMETRMSRFKMGLFIVIVGILSNVFQYVMGGPYFLGFSGVVVGMVGFIWMRQKVAPWEGYPLQRATILFIFFFVLAMSALELVSLTLQAFSVVSLSANIANTAHIVGGLVGVLLGKSPFFARQKDKVP